MKGTNKGRLRYLAKVIVSRDKMIEYRERKKKGLVGELMISREMGRERKVIRNMKNVQAKLKKTVLEDTQSSKQAKACSRLKI